MAEAKHINGLTVNDGKGLLDNEGLIDQIIIRLNGAVKSLVDGQYINFCGSINELGQMLVTLKKAYTTEVTELRSRVEDLKRFNHDLNEELCKTQRIELEDEFTKDGGD